MLALAERPDGAWRPEIIKTVAMTGEGVDDVVEALDTHLAHLRKTGELEARRVHRAREEIEAIAVTALRARWGDVHARTELDDLAEQVVTGRTDPYAAADELLASYTD
jgi:LAO/AO transport system kinase